MYEIVSRLYLSNYEDAKDVPRSMFVVNCSMNLPMTTTYGMRLPVNDDLRMESMDIMSRSLPVVVDHIHNIISSGGEVLVHCAAGQQRSAAVVAAYLMTTQGMSIQQAVEYIKTKKPDAFLTGVNFEKSLKEYEAYIRNGNYRFA